MNPHKSQIHNEIKEITKDMSFIIKKTYRIALGVNVISKCLLESDPFRNALRQESRVLLLLTATFHKKGSLEKDMAFESIENTLLGLEKTLFALWSSADISEQNYTLLQESITKTLELIKGNGLPFKGDVGEIGSQSRVLVDRNWLVGTDVSQDINQQSFTKHTMSNRVTVKKIVTPVQPSKGHVSEEKSERIQKILKFIKDKKEVSIKDIMSVVHGVASKTVQRDVQELIDAGQVKKMGAKRWARYVYLR